VREDGLLLILCLSAICWIPRSSYVYIGFDRIGRLWIGRRMFAAFWVGSQPISPVSCIAGCIVTWFFGFRDVCGRMESHSRCTRID
jgi:hypothetical protein